MLRIITDQAEALTELGRINHRSTDRDFRLQEAAVRDILESVRVQGDAALLPLTDSDPKTSSLRVSGSELDAAYQQIPKDLLNAIQVACRQLDTFHRQQLPKSWVKFAEDEVVQGKRYLPVQRAGLYVSGSRGSRLSNLLMQAIPAKVAQVPQIVMVTPGNEDNKIAPDLLVAAQEVGIEEIYRLDRVKAIAALAYGTRSIPKVEVITGTGDLEVAIAKNLVNGLVRIDNPIERTDLVVIADSSANPLQIAADLLSQAEQDPTSALILFTSDRQIAATVQAIIQDYFQENPQNIPMQKAIAHYGLIVVLDSLDLVVEMVNQFSPYYLLLAVAEPWDLAEKIHHARTIFLGQSSPKAIGDYMGGNSLLISTEGTLRSASTVGVETFLKQSNLIQYSPIALKKLSQTLQILVKVEGLAAPMETIRLRNPNQKPTDPS